MRNGYKVYIAGPITPTGKGNHAVEYLRNVRLGVVAAIQLIKMGFTPICPMIDFQYFLCCDGDDEITAAEIYEVSIELMLGCDMIFKLPNTDKSEGWKEESIIAYINNIPIYTTLMQMEELSEQVKRS